MILLKHFTLNKRHVIVMFVFGGKTIRMEGMWVGCGSSSLKEASNAPAGLFILYSVALIPFLPFT